MVLRIISNGEQRTYVIENFHKEVVSFGRQPDNDIVFDGEYVSRVHGAIYQEDGAYYIEDMKSTNGIYLNGRKIDRARISPGNHIILTKNLNSLDRVEIIVETDTYQQGNPGNAVQSAYNSGGYETQPKNPPHYGRSPYYHGGYWQDPYMPMAWYKFLIYFALFASAAILLYNAVNSFSLATNLFDVEYDDSYDEYSEFVDEILGTEISDVTDSDTLGTEFAIGGALLLILACMAVWVRFQLAGFKDNAPSQFYMYLVIQAIVGCYYGVLTGQTMQIESYSGYAYSYNTDYLTTDEMWSAILVEWGITALMSAIYIALNKSYFDKRKHMFTNQ